MSEHSTIARPYAVAAFSQAQHEEQLQQWSDMLALVASVVADPSMAALVDDPRLSQEQLTTLVLDVGGDRLSAAGQNFVRVLVENDRLSLVHQISRLYEELRAQAEGRLEVEVISAYAVSAAQKRTLTEALERRLGRTINLTATIDKELIGGVIIRAGDQVIDGSLRAGLNQLAIALRH